MDKRKLESLTKNVEDIMRNKPETRDSDDRLYLEVVRQIDSSLLTMFLGSWLMFRSAHGLPSIESVGRCRRKVQEKFPELRGSKEVQQFREELQETFFEYAME